MAELSHEAATTVVGHFLDAFNARNSSSFSISTFEPPEDQSCDYLCLDGHRLGEALKVQMTRAVSFVVTESGVCTLHSWVYGRSERVYPSVIYETPRGSAVRAVKHKANRLGTSAADLVLLIFYDLRSLDAVDLAEMTTAIRRLELPFREVWAVWSFQGKRGSAHLIWPVPSVNSPGIAQAPLLRGDGVMARATRCSLEVRDRAGPTGEP